MLPIDFENRMKDLLLSEYDEFINSYDLPKYQSLRLNLCKVEKSDDISFLPFTLKNVPWEESGYYYANTDRPGKHPFHEAGVYYIQEPSAMAPAHYLNVKEGEYICDLCAAPGGKSTQIASYLKQSGLLLSNEIHPARSKILSENIERMGLSNCIVTNETPARLRDKFPSYFDKIMVDAPCSGEGMFRKNTDACEEWSLENVSLCASRQAEILDCAADMLRSGGRIVYSTCTFAPAENEESIARFLCRHPEFHVVAVPFYDGMAPGNKHWLSEECQKEVAASSDPDGLLEQLSNTIRLWPHKLQGEGHFVAVLQKDGVLDKESRPSCTDGYAKEASSKNLSALFDFLKDEKITLPKGVYTTFGDQIYLLPPNAPSLEKCKILRPGLHLGTILKNRFEPSHALALYLKPSQVLHSFMISSKDPTIYRYLNGETFSCDSAKGWYLICVDQFSIGWGKCAGGIMKNHYPKGLRKKLD